MRITVTPMTFGEIVELIDAAAPQTGAARAYRARKAVGKLKKSRYLRKSVKTFFLFILSDLHEYRSVKDVCRSMLVQHVL